MQLLVRVRRLAALDVTCRRRSASRAGRGDAPALDRADPGRRTPYPPGVVAPRRVHSRVARHRLCAHDRPPCGTRCDRCASRRRGPVASAVTDGFDTNVRPGTSIRSTQPSATSWCVATHCDAFRAIRWRRDGSRHCSACRRSATSPCTWFPRRSVTSLGPAQPPAPRFLSAPHARGRTRCTRRCPRGYRRRFSQCAARTARAQPGPPAASLSGRHRASGTHELRTRGALRCSWDSRRRSSAWRSRTSATWLRS